MHETQNVIDGSAIDRNAGTLGCSEKPHDFIERSFDGERMHVRPGNHDFADWSWLSSIALRMNFSSPGASRPRSRACWIWICNSSVEWATSRPVGSMTPKALTTAPEMPPRRLMAQRNVLRNHRNGRATIKAMRSARARLMDFGTSSPKTTWMALNRMKASV